MKTPPTLTAANGGIKKSGFIEFCEGLKPGDGLVKSASYLMHSRNFSNVRDFLLRNSASLLQDDSCIPVKYFKADEWKLQPFGRYRGPISLFRRHYQRKLARLFKKGDRKPIDFGIGYRWRSNQSNLLLATSVRDHTKSATAE